MIPIIYQDSHFVVANKPSGLLVHRYHESPDRTFLLQQLRDQLGKRLYPIHRLDRPVSGLICFAFSSEDGKRLQQSLSHGIKKYLALVKGRFPSHKVYEWPLKNERKLLQYSFTDVTKIQEFERCSLVEVSIKTGRRHQIRRHLSHSANQVIGDTKYGKGRINQFFRDEFQLQRIFLHAHRLQIQHPITNERLSFDCPLPEDLQKILTAL